MSSYGDEASDFHTRKTPEQANFFFVSRSCANNDIHIIDPK